jgi:holliday junction resolvase YEN1
MYVHSLIQVDLLTHAAQILRPSGKLRSLTHIAVVDGFEANPANLRGLRIGIDASIWFFHAVYGRKGENPELRTLFFRCAKLVRTPFLPLFVFDGPKRPKVKRGKRITGERHWLVDSMKGIIEAFGFEWRMVHSKKVALSVGILLTASQRPLERQRQNWLT